SISLCQHTAPSELYSLSLPDALPIFGRTVFWYYAMTESIERPRSFTSRLMRRIKQMSSGVSTKMEKFIDSRRRASVRSRMPSRRSEEHTSELQSRENLVCRLLLE